MAYVHVGGASAIMSYVQTNSCNPTTVSFSTSNPINVLMYHWDFGDGNTLSGYYPAVSHSYTLPGVYHPVLLLEDSLGCVSMAQPAVLDSVTVDDNPFTAITPVAPTCTGIPVNLTSISSSPLSPLASWQWSFGDGGVQNGSFPANPNTSHTYAAGTYTVIFSVTTQGGCVGSDTISLTILPNPVAAYGMSASSQCSPVTVTFTDLTPGTIISSFWDFGDGTTGTGTPVSHTYTLPGHYTPMLIVQDSSGCVDTFSVLNGVLADSILALFSLPGIPGLLSLSCRV